jgi:cell division protein FtsI/penicillin-binding protein 2
MFPFEHVLVRLTHRPQFTDNGSFAKKTTKAASVRRRTGSFHGRMKNLLVPALLLFGLLVNGTLAQQSKSGAAAPKSKKTTVNKKTALKKRRSPEVDPTNGDNVDGEDLVIRRAAVDALGLQAGSVVVADPNSGRVLTVVNQKLALRSGFIPCSVIKLVTALAALTEHVVTREAPVRLTRYASLDLTTALAHSNNPYFATLGERLGFERVVRYARLLGLGEKAGLDIPGEQPGDIAAQPPKWGGMGLMTSFGEGFLMTPLELAALLGAVANGGTLYYLQYPRNPYEIEHFMPRIKRALDLGPSGFEDIKVGMRGAVDYGTAKRANDPGEMIWGKTGTCTDFPTGNHMGWFGSFTEPGEHQLVVVVMLTSPIKSVSGAVASGIAGEFYRKLSMQGYFPAVSAAKAKTSDLPDILAEPHAQE